VLEYGVLEYGVPIREASSTAAGPPTRARRNGWLRRGVVLGNLVVPPPPHPADAPGRELIVDRAPAGRSDQLGRDEAPLPIDVLHFVPTLATKDALNGEG
jgi:hypothetical protein